MFMDGFNTLIVEHSQLDPDYIFVVMSSVESIFNTAFNLSISFAYNVIVKIRTCHCLGLYNMVSNLKNIHIPETDT